MITAIACLILWLAAIMRVTTPRHRKDDLRPLWYFLFAIGVGLWLTSMIGERFTPLWIFAITMVFAFTTSYWAMKLAEKNASPMLVDAIDGMSMTIPAIVSLISLFFALW